MFGPSGLQDLYTPYSSCSAPCDHHLKADEATKAVDMNFYFMIYAGMVLLVQGFSSFGGDPRVRNMGNLRMSNDQLGRVTMYIKQGCPFCERAKDLLESEYKLEIAYVDVESENQSEILQQMRTFSGGRNTVPQIFFNSNHLGGNDDVQTLHTEGKLNEMVDEVKATKVSMMMDGWFHPWY